MPTRRVNGSIGPALGLVSDGFPSGIAGVGTREQEFVRDDAGRWRIRSRRCEVENL